VGVDESVLKGWVALADDPGTAPQESRMLYPINRASEDVLRKMGRTPRIGADLLKVSWGWDEAAARKQGLIARGSVVQNTWQQVILQGPHLTVGTPLNQQPNESMRNNRDYSVVDLESISEDFMSMSRVSWILGDDPW
jgi:hypothetical protein